MLPQNDKIKQIMKPNNENDILKIIEKSQQQFQKFKENCTDQMQIILLIGLTGSGKSTIFNFLAGADFKIENNQLAIENQNDCFSKMSQGMNSITKNPNFYYIPKQNHMIIDFPGFNDTNGELDQLLFQLLFHRIITSGPTKIVYVVNNPSDSLPNRGSDVQEFIRNLSKINIQKFNLFLNCFMENLSNQQLKNKIQEELKTAELSQFIENIFILRKVRTDEDVSKILNSQMRENMWKEIVNIKPFQIIPIKLPNTEFISEYLRKTTLSTVASYGSVLCNAFYQNTQKLNNSDRKTTLKSLIQLQSIFKSQQEEDSLSWYLNFISVCEQLTTILKIKNDNNLQMKNDSMVNMHHFKTIFIYFSQFSQFISGYDDIKITQSIAEIELKQLVMTLNAAVEYLRKAEQDEVKINQINIQNQKLQEDLANINKEVIQKTIQLKNVETLSRKQIQEKQQEIQNLKQQQAQITEQKQNIETQLKKINEEKEIQIKQMNSKIQELLDRPPQVTHIYNYETKYFCYIF